MHFNGCVSSQFHILYQKGRMTRDQGTKPQSRLSLQLQVVYCKRKADNVSAVGFHNRELSDTRLSINQTEQE